MNCVTKKINCETMKVLARTLRDCFSRIPNAPMRHHLLSKLEAICDELDNWEANGFLEVPSVDPKELEKT